jgi:hypothetical protein
LPNRAIARVEDNTAVIGEMLNQWLMVFLVTALKGSFEAL